jgi:hypothetical protein
MILLPGKSLPICGGSRDARATPRARALSLDDRRSRDQCKAPSEKALHEQYYGKSLGEYLTPNRAVAE